MNFDKFKTVVPGTSDLKLSSKVVLANKGEKTSLVGNDFQATLKWKTAVDLDLHCFYRLKVETEPTSKGILGKFFSKSGDSKDGHVFFSKRGNKTSSPWIYLDRDAGVGDSGGDNEENIYLTKIDRLEHALIVANIYNKPDSIFSTYDGVVSVRGGGRETEVPLIERTPGSWCVIARIDNTSDTPQLTNVNKTQRNEPSILQFV